MATKSRNTIFIRGKRIRATRVDNCGRVVYGDNARVVSKGQVSIGYTANTTETDAITVPNSDGETLASVPSETQLVGYGVEAVFTGLDPDLFSLWTGAPVFYDADGVAVGVAVDTSISLAGRGIALEVWTGAPAGDACADVASQGSFGYVLTPFLQGGILGDFSVENGAINMTLTGAQTRDGNNWGVGPYDVMLNKVGNAKVPGPLVNPLTATQPLLLTQVELAPPVVEQGFRPLLDPEADAITSITATKSGRLVTLAAVPDPESDTGVWYDFGDGEWDYVLGGDTAHTYTAAGTYTIKASTNGTWVETSVTLT